MIINSLCRYYDILSNDKNIKIPEVGFSIENVGFEFNINNSGELIGIIPLMQTITRNNKNYEISLRMIVPEKAKKTGNIIADFLCGNAEYVIGLTKSTSLKDQEKCHERNLAFKKLHHELIDSRNILIGDIFLKFLDSYNYERYEDIIEPYKEQLEQGRNIVFKVDNKYLHEDESLKQVWIDKRNNELKEAIKMQCMVTGDLLPIARLHPSIKGVKEAQSSGASIVSFNDDAYESYSKEKGYNAPVSDLATFKYTTTLNYLLASDTQQIQFGDATTVFWAESDNQGYIDLINLLLEPPLKDNHNSKVEDIQTERNIMAILRGVREGKRMDFSFLGLNPETKFYILGLAPNMSRLSVRFFYSSPIKVIEDNCLLHYHDLSIEKNYSNEPDIIPVWRLINETKNPKSNDNPNPLLSGSIIRAILMGTMYPRNLYTSIINRIRCDRDSDNGIKQINYVRVAIIKAYLSRYSRIYYKKEYEEVLTMSLNEESIKVPYLLGRLFAVLEKGQKDANPGINATIKDRYFSSACATPASVFPILLKLAQNHISKADYGYVSNGRIEDILSKMDGQSFPKHLSLEDQGSFIIGYYHQSNAFYKSSGSDKVNINENIEESREENGSN